MPERLRGWGVGGAPRCRLTRHLGAAVKRFLAGRAGHPMGCLQGESKALLTRPAKGRLSGQGELRVTFGVNNLGAEAERDSQAVGVIDEVGLIRLGDSDRPNR